MADIARILAEVLLGNKQAIQGWKDFANAGVDAFKRLNAACTQSTLQMNAALGRVSAKLKTVGAETIALGRHIKRAGSMISLFVGAPLLLIGKLAIDTFKKQADGWGSSQRLLAENEKATEAFQKALAGLGKTLIPIASEITRALTSVLEAFNKLDPATKKWIVLIGVIAIALGPVVFALSGVVMGIGLFISALGLISSGFALAIPAIALFIQALGFVIGVVLEIGIAIATAVGWPVIIAAALGAVLVLVFTHWEQVKQIISDAMDWIGEKLHSAWEGLGGVVQVAIDLWKAAWNLFFAYLNSKWSGLGDFVKSVLQGMVAPITNMIHLAQELWAWLTKAASVPVVNKSGGGEKKAHGGLIRGRAGVDRIPAWLTNNEFVQRVAAVRKYGLGFMQAVNSGRFPLELAHGFAGGGLVGRPRMAFARGGLATGADRSFTLVIGDKSFGGLRAPEDTADQMLRFARSAQIRSGGRKPPWFGEGG